MTERQVSDDYKKLSTLLPSIKGVAILMIVLYHINQIFNQSGLTWPYSFPDLVNRFFEIGELGVEIFLISSGFGLTASWWRQYQATGTFAESFNILDFWKRRLLKIIPLFWLAHGFALILGLINSNSIYFNELFTENIIQSVLVLLGSMTTIDFFLSKEYAFAINPAWWFMGLIIQLYMIFPLLIYCAVRWGWFTLWMLSIFLTFGSRAIISQLPFSAESESLLTLGIIFPVHLFEFVFGMILAIAILDPKIVVQNTKFNRFLLFIRALIFQKRYLLINIFLLIVGLTSFFSKRFLYTIPSNAILAVSLFSLSAQACIWLSTYFRYAFLVLSDIGNYSFGIYLTHMNIILVIDGMISHLFLLSSFIPRMALTTILCCLIGKYFELAYNRLRYWLYCRFGE